MEQEQRDAVYWLMCFIAALACIVDGALEYIYMMEFILSDGTGWICVGLWKQQAVIIIIIEKLVLHNVSSCRSIGFLFILNRVIAAVLV